MKKCLKEERRVLVEMWRALKGSRDQRRTGVSRVKEKLKKKRERIWWRYGERSKGQVRRTGQSRVKEWR